MTAPESVVRAVMEHAVRGDAERARAIADAAFAASLEHLADNIDLRQAYEYDDAEYRNAESAAEAWLRTADKP